MPTDMKRQLVYGPIAEDEDVVFIPCERAEYLAALHEATDRATTWGELRERIPPDEFDRLARTEFDEEVAAFDELDPAEQQEFLGRAFEAGEVAAIFEGDWPGWPQQEMLEWMPDEIQEEFGKVGRSMVTGPCLQIDSASGQAVVAALEARGYTCAEDTGLVSRASGL